MRPFLLALLALGLALAAPPRATAQNGPLRIEITEGVTEPLPFAIPTFVAENRTVGRIETEEPAVGAN